MKNGIIRLVFPVLFTTFSIPAFAQSGSGSGSSYFYVALIATVALLALGVVLQVASSLLRVEAKNLGVEDEATSNFSLMPSFGSWFGKKRPDFVGADARIVNLQKGHDINLAGAAGKTIGSTRQANTFGVKPTDFVGISPIPKVEVAQGDVVKAGDVIFFDKKRPNVKYAAPVSGEVVAINRGEKRSIAEVVILGDKNGMQYREYNVPNAETASREELVDFLLGSGAWPMIRQRPYDVVADPNDIPKAIFISTFDSAPLAPDLNLVVEGREADFQKGLDVLAKLTNGKVHLGLDGRHQPAAAFVNATGVDKTYFNGPHPAGNVGIQIHHVNPIVANERVWIMGVQEVITLGTLFTSGRFDASRVVALTGAELKEPEYVRTYLGANVESFLKDNLTNETVRVVSGDVLSGKQIEANGYLGFYDDQLTVLEEGDYYEMFGWLLPLSPRPSVSGTYPNGLFKGFKFKANTNTHGEKRAFVVTGQYEDMLPMDVYPQHLMKAILVNDYERMEGLGIYELSEEDVALAEFACTSKQPLQQILRRGLDMMREQG